MEEINNTSPKPNNIKDFFRSWNFWKPFLGIVIGGGAGLLYFYLVGCSTGSCPITSSAWGTVITGGLFGLIITSSPCARSKC